MPTYCPMMDRNFVEVRKRRSKASPVASRQGAYWLSVSFDPKNDARPPC